MDEWQIFGSELDSLIVSFGSIVIGHGISPPPTAIRTIPGVRDNRRMDKYHRRPDDQAE